MQQALQGYRGLSLLMNLNWDRLLYAGTLAVALSLGAFVGSILN